MLRANRSAWMSTKEPRHACSGPRQATEAHSAQVLALQRSHSTLVMEPKRTGRQDTNAARSMASDDEFYKRATASLPFHARKIYHPCLSPSSIVPCLLPLSRHFVPRFCLMNFFVSLRTEIHCLCSPSRNSCASLSSNFLLPSIRYGNGRPPHHRPPESAASLLPLLSWLTGSSRERTRL